MATVHKIGQYTLYGVLAELLGPIMILTSQEGGPSGNLRTCFSPSCSVIRIIFMSGDSAQKGAEDIVAQFLIFGLVREKLETIQKRVRRSAVVNIAAKFPTHCM